METNKSRHILRAVYCMIKKCFISRRKLMLDFQLLLKRSKIAGKVIANLLTFNQDGNFTDPNLSFCNQREVEFSCGNTPSFPTFISKRKNNHRKNYSHDYETVAAITKAFKMMNDNCNGISDAEESVSLSPMAGLIGRSTPMTVRRLRITDSPFPIGEDEVMNDGRVDREAEEFINKFYEQLRMQYRIYLANPKYEY